MERLTHIDHLGWYINRRDGSRIRGSHINRLAAYEDTGLEPEDIIGLKNTCDQLYGINDSLFNANQEMGKDLAEWKKAHDDGRMVVLPCKVGDTAMVKDRAGVPREMRLEAPDIRFVCTDEDNFCGATCNRKPDGFCAYRIRNDGSDIGKTVFLISEEAEAELAGKGGDG